MVEYSNVKIPRAFFKKLESFLKSHSDLGYRNPSEFIMECARKNFDQLVENAKEEKSDEIDD